ncbi:hypothetical protein ACIHCX_10630 [Streptomyces sp. NPDC052043]|uniref:hypothetical protein n=1 Tax=Streptomyces sp. NPDC052043 TaxID=3365684 RepID=UPI0037D72917
MGDTARPIPDRLGDQHEQAQHLTSTGNGPTVDDEQRLLAEQFGAPDMSGVYTGPELVDQDDEPEAAADEPADEGDAPAADTAEGGESA